MKTIANAMIRETLMKELAGVVRDINIDGNEQNLQRQ